jgi:hypothetical protein
MAVGESLGGLAGVRLLAQAGAGGLIPLASGAKGASASLAEGVYGALLLDGGPPLHERGRFRDLSPPGEPWRAFQQLLAGLRPWFETVGLKLDTHSGGMRVEVVPAFVDPLHAFASLLGSKAPSPPSWPCNWPASCRAGQATSPSAMAAAGPTCPGGSPGLGPATSATTAGR